MTLQTKKPNGWSVEGTKTCTEHRPVPNLVLKHTLLPYHEGINTPHHIEQRPTASLLPPPVCFLSPALGQLFILNKDENKIWYLCSPPQTDSSLVLEHGIRRKEVVLKMFNVVSTQNIQRIVLILPNSSCFFKSYNCLLLA